VTCPGSVAIIEPSGIHAISLNAGRLLPHLPAYRFPGHALACELYLEGGIRSAELGSLHLGEEDGDRYHIVGSPAVLRHFPAKREPVPIPRAGSWTGIRAVIRTKERGTR
jgi:tryptophanase